MTDIKVAYAEWCNRARRQAVWAVDKILWVNSFTLLATSPNHQYVMCTIDGKLEIGTYEPSGQFVTDGLFMPLHSRKFDSQTDAFEVLSKKLGMESLVKEAHAITL